MIRQFLYHASHHTIEELQAFTSQWVPHPAWVRVDNVTIPEQYLSEAATAISAQLGEDGIKQVGGSTWWQWRRNDAKLEAEWIEMRGDYNARKRLQERGRRVMLYVHGGAYFFGSVDEHRYQMQRHARKLRAKVFAPRYRLSPQFPFPCGLQDCLAAYLYLLTVQEPTEIILAGDSAGGGMVVAMLVTLRDRNLPPPAGAVLISPWVDLTHSFPSVTGTNDEDYIPSHGFMQRPSASWPPPNDDEVEATRKGADRKPNREGTPRKSSQSDKSADKAFAVHDADKAGDPVLDPKHQPSILLDGSLVVIKDQIQMYTTNALLAHPLVSTILQPSLGGLPPLLILTGGGEILRDEQMYLAHKAANPTKYPPPDFHLAEFDADRSLLNKYKPTYVQLQVWDDLCHVAPTLSFTRPAKFMYRSIAQFGAWALARAQKTAIDILDDDDISVISSGSDTSTSTSDDEDEKPSKKAAASPESPTSQIGRAGDPLPPFQSYMIRQRVDRHGGIYPLAPTSQLPGCQLPSEEIGVIKPGPVRKWIAAKKEWDTRYRREKRRVQKQRIKEMMDGYVEFGEGEIPPPSALAGRRKKGADEVMREKKRKSYGMMLWSLWGSNHDKKTMEREDEMERREGENTAADTTGENGKEPKKRRETISEGRETRDGDVVVDTTSATVPITEPPTSAKTLSPNFKPSSRSQSRRRKEESFASRSRSRRRAVTDTGQTESEAIDAVNDLNHTAPAVPTNPMITLPNNTDPAAASSSATLRSLSQTYNKHLLIRTSIASSSGVAPDSASILSSRTNASTAAVIGAAGVLHTRTHPTGTSDQAGSVPQSATDAGENESLMTITRPETPPSRGSMERLRSHQVGLETDGEGEGEAEGRLGHGLTMAMERLRSPSTVAVVGSEGVILKVRNIEAETEGEAQAKKKEKENTVGRGSLATVENSTEARQFEPMTTAAAAVDGTSNLAKADADTNAKDSGTGVNENKQEVSSGDVDKESGNGSRNVVGNGNKLDDPDAGAEASPSSSLPKPLREPEPEPDQQQEETANTNANRKTNTKRPGMYERGDTEFMTAREG